jgi:hypothetical protein
MPECNGKRACPRGREYKGWKLFVSAKWVTDISKANSKERPGMETENSNEAQWSVVLELSHLILLILPASRSHFLGYILLALDIAKMKLFRGVRRVGRQNTKYSITITCICGS